MVFFSVYPSDVDWKVLIFLFRYRFQTMFFNLTLIRKTFGVFVKKDVICCCNATSDWTAGATVICEPIRRSVFLAWAWNCFTLNSSSFVVNTYAIFKIGQVWATRNSLLFLKKKFNANIFLSGDLQKKRRMRIFACMCVCEYVSEGTEPHLIWSMQMFFSFLSFPFLVFILIYLFVFNISFLNMITFFNICFIFFYLTLKPIFRSEYCFIFVFISSETLLSSQNKNLSEVVDRNQSLSMLDIDK